MVVYLAYSATVRVPGRAKRDDTTYPTFHKIDRVFVVLSVDSLVRRHGETPIPTSGKRAAFPLGTEPDFPPKLR
jgi:hypothetical protein